MSKKFFWLMVLSSGLNEAIIARPLPVRNLSKAAKIVGSIVAGGYIGHRSAQEYFFYRQRTAAKIAFLWRDNKEDKPITLFSHGNGENEQQVEDYCVHGKTKSSGAFIQQDGLVVSVRYKNAPEDRFNRGAISSKDSHLGQDGDMAVVVDALQTHRQTDCVGVSRGAATLVNVLGAYDLTNKEIGSAVLESPFATVQDVIGHELGMPGKLFGHAIELGLAHSRFKGYSSYGIRPLDVAHKIDASIPLLFVCSQEDAKIPVSSTMKLAIRSHSKAHILVLEKGKHGALVKGDDGIIYRNVVHAFWRHYGRPHNSEWADAGRDRFEAIIK